MMRTTSGRMKVVRAFLNIVLKVIGFVGYALERAAIFLIGTLVK
jgi:hypothetical protein